MLLSKYSIVVCLTHLQELSQFFPLDIYQILTYQSVSFLPIIDTSLTSKAMKDKEKHIYMIFEQNNVIHLDQVNKKFLSMIKFL